MVENVVALLGKANTLRQSGDIAAALEFAEQARATFPEDVRGHMRCAQLLLELQRADDARRHLAAALETFENHPALLGLLARAHVALRDTEAALAVSRRLHRHHASAASWRGLVNLLVASKRIDEAAATTQEALSAFPDDQGLLAAGTGALRLAGDYDGALRLAETLRRANPDIVAGHLGMALALDRLGRIPEALAAAEAGLALFPTNTMLLRSALRSAVALGRHRQAQDYAARRVALDPGFVQDHVDLLGSAIRANDLGAAGRHAEAAMTRFPENKVIQNLAWVVRETLQERPPLDGIIPAPPTPQNTRYLFSIPFNLRRFERLQHLSDHAVGRLSDRWISRRLQIFMNYTCKSLRNQTNQDFHVLFLCDPASLDLVAERLAAYDPLPPNIEVIDGSKAPGRLLELMRHHERVCHTTLDSDNMYHRDYVEYLHRHVPDERTRFLAFTKGYTFNALSGELAVYRATKEYFYALVGRVAEWPGFRNVPAPRGGSEQAKAIPHELIHEPSMFIITCHDTNVADKATLVHPNRLLHDPVRRERIWHDFVGDAAPFLLPADDGDGGLALALSARKAAAGGARTVSTP